MRKVSLTAVLFLICIFCNSLQAGEAIKPESYRINQIEWQQNGGVWVCAIKGDMQPAYTMYELFSPHRVIIDIAQGVFGAGVSFPMKFNEGPVSQVQGTVLTGQAPGIARLELHLASERPYSVTGSGNDILVQFDKTMQESKEETGAAEAVITDVSISSTGEKTAVYLKSNGPIQSYQSTEQAKGSGSPARLIVDIAGVKTNGHAVPGGGDSPVALVRTENYQTGTRVVVDSAADALFRYSIMGQSDGLLINVEPVADDPSSVIAEIVGLPASAAVSKPSESEIKPLARTAEMGSAQSVKKSTKKAGDQDFAFAGYTQQKISVDFYKIDLHNVFRLIGEISGRNIVVGEGVNGSLTLALNDVPWDFVLDVILNLKGLAKEERFNTIVISQKSDEFAWPETAEEKLAITQETLSVTKRMDVPKEMLEATKVVRQAKTLEDSGNYAGAMALYEKAYQAWPDNGELAKRITNLALGRLGLSAKAAHYGQIASRLLPNDKGVALQTALGLANMERVSEARDYFDVAVSDARPSRQSLAGYAAFSEKNGSYEMALALLGRYESLYGTSLETMVSKARIYDKVGDAAKATSEYRGILLSGYQVPADLENYIKERLQK
ncbi:MAG: hypothetical protein V1706_14560 [Pseudomonadota bacterium]